MTSGCIGQVYFCFFLLLACRAGGRRAGRRRVLAMGVLRDHRVGHRQHKCTRDYGCNVFLHFRLVVGQAPRLPAGKTATAAVALQTVRDCDCSTRRKAEREREGSAARSIQRTKMRRVVRCRVTAAQQLATNTQRTRPPERENSHRRISHHCVPNLLFSQKRQRAGFCSTAPAMIVLFVSQAWNGMGTRFAPCRFPLRPPRTRNDSRPRSRNRS